MRPAIGLFGAAAALTAAAPAWPATTTAAATAPTVAQLVVARSGSARESSVRAAATSVSLGSKRCAVPAGTALAALLASRVAAIGLHDYGACSGRGADAAGLFVNAIGRDRNRGADGWVYKVGNRLATAGAADGGGPFGSGPLRSGARLTWFYCHLSRSTGRCQATLALSAQALGGGAVRAAVRAYDDTGRARPAAGATVRSGSVSATAGGGGSATLTLAPGRRRIYAQRSGAIRSFSLAVDVR